MPTATASPTPVRPAAALAWVNTAGELRVWDPVSGQSSLLGSVVASMQWEWAPGGRYIAYEGADREARNRRACGGPEAAHSCVRELRLGA